MKFFNNHTDYGWRKEKETQKHLFVGTTITSLQNEFYRSPRTSLQYCLTTASHTGRHESTFPSFLQFCFLLTDIISHYPLLSESHRLFLFLKYQAHFHLNAFALKVPCLKCSSDVHITDSLTQDTSWDGTFLTTQSKTKQLPTSYLSKHKISIPLILIFDIFLFIYVLSRFSTKKDLFHCCVLANRTVWEYFG